MVLARVHEQRILLTFTVFWPVVRYFYQSHIFLGHFWQHRCLTVIPLLSENPVAFYALYKSSPVETHKRVWRKLGNVAALVRSHINGLKAFERTIEQTIETMPPSPKTITAAAMTRNRSTSLRELLHYREKVHSKKSQVNWTKQIE